VKMEAVWLQHPRDGGREPVADQHQALLRPAIPPACTRPARDLPPRTGGAMAEPIRPGVGRVVQQVLERHPVGPPPFQVPPVRPGVGPNGDEDWVRDQVAEGPLESRLAVELVEDQPHRIPDLFVGVDHPHARGQADGADRRRAQEFAAAGLVELALVHPLLEDRKFCLAHHAVQAQEEAVVVVGRVVQPVGAGQQGVGSSTELPQLMPILARAGQPAHLEPEDQPDAVERPLGEQPPESRPAQDGLAAHAQVVVADGDPPPVPAELDRPVGQGVQACGRFLVVGDLLGAGLADVDDGGPVEVPGPELGGSGGVIHGRPPRGAWPRGAGRGACRAGRGVAASCRRAGGSPGEPAPGAGAERWT
jgi:hypothetical protein